MVVPNRKPQYKLPKYDHPSGTPLSSDAEANGAKHRLQCFPVSAKADEELI